MADKLLIVLSSIDISRAEAILPPLSQANIAAAMDYDVEVLFTGHTGRLSIKGVAEKITLEHSSYQNIYELIKEGFEAGVKYKVCTPSLDLWGDDLIAEIGETVGGAYMISETMDDSVATLAY